MMILYYTNIIIMIQTKTLIHLKRVPKQTTTIPQLRLDPTRWQDPFLATYRNSIINEFLKELDHAKPSRKKNLSNKISNAMRDLHNNPDITILPVDKGDNIVIMNTTDYILEAQRQLNNPQHHKILTTDPTIQYNRYIHHLIDRAWGLGIIDRTSKENLQTKNPKNASFYFLPKIHKLSNSGRLIVNSTGSITEKISAFVDEHLRRFIPRIPCYVKDTTHFTNIIKNIQLGPDDLHSTPPIMKKNMQRFCFVIGGFSLRAMCS